MIIQKFERFIINLKKKTDPKVLGIILFMSISFLIITSLQMGENFKRQKDLLENEYNRSMYEMIGYIKNIDLQFTKLQITKDKSVITSTLADIWRQSNLAKDNLSNLPIAQETLSNTAKYLAQVSDYSYLLMKNTVKGEEISNEQYEVIAKLSENANELLGITNNIFNELTTGRIKWDEVEKVGTDNLEKNNEISNIGDISKVFQDYEGLIYDGAFSEHILNMKPKYLDGLEDVTEEYARKEIERIFSDNIKSIEYVGENNNNNLDLYNYSVIFNDGINKNISITKKGNKVYSILSNKNVEKQILTVEDAKKIGIEFLKTIGIENVKDTYYLITENLVTINYAAMQDNVILYPDLVKVKIALDNGDICSLETAGYTYNHTERKVITPNISDKNIKINNNFKVLNTSIAIIPTDSKGEILTYEFKGTINEKECLIYLNAITGNEEKILMIINSPNGTLTM